MEDAHIARTKVPIHDGDENPGEAGSDVGETAKVFGVFDGHGGSEVARFCQLYLVSVLTQQGAFKQAVQKMYSNNNNSSTLQEGDVPEVNLSPKQTDMGQALVSTFHELDRMIGDPPRR